MQTLKERTKKKREKFIRSLSIRLWRWDRDKSFLIEYGPLYLKVAIICLYATKSEQLDNLTWHNKAFRFYTSGEYVNYEPEKTEENIIKEMQLN